MRWLWAPALVVGLILPLAAEAGPIAVSRAWSRATAAPGAVGVGFMTIDNAGAADRLTGAACDGAASVMLDETSSETMEMNGAPMTMDHMAEVAAIPVPAHGRVVLKPGGWHLMPGGLAGTLNPGDTLACTLHFAGAGDVGVKLRVQGPGDADYAKP